MFRCVCHPRVRLSKRNRRRYRWDVTHFKHSLQYIYCCTEYICDFFTCEGKLPTICRCFQTEREGLECKYMQNERWRQQIECFVIRRVCDATHVGQISFRQFWKHGVVPVVLSLSVVCPRLPTKRRRTLTQNGLINESVWSLSFFYPDPQKDQKKKKRKKDDEH